MYASTAQLRIYLKQVEIGAEMDAQLTAVLTRATDRVRSALRAALADTDFDYAAWPTAATKIVRGYWAQYLRLPPHQAGSVTLVEEETGSNPASYTTVTDQWLQESGRLFRAGGWSEARYRVTAVWGYGPDIPGDVEEITLEVAVNLWRSKDKGGFSELVGVEGSGAVRAVAGLTRDQLRSLEALAAQIGQVHL